MKRVLKPNNEVSQSALNQARALYYDFFAGFFLYELLDSRKDLFAKQIDILVASPIDEANLTHFYALKSYIVNTNLETIKREYSQTFDIPFGAKPELDYTKGNNKNNQSSDLDKFNNESNASDESLAFEKLHKTLSDLPKGQIFLYLSHYTEGCLNGASLLKVRQIVKQTHFRLNKECFKESEEHFGFLLLFMRYLLRDSVQDSNKSSVNANEFFNECLRPMASKIATSLIKRKDLHCYQKVGILLNSFIKLEEEICAF